MRRLLIGACLVLAAGAVAFWVLTRPDTIAAADLPDHTPDPEHGAYVFHAAGCNSCHAAPEAEGEEKMRLGGGLAFETPFGTFRAPNVSPDPEHGIGGWSDVDFVNAVMRGLAPDGSHYYPAFPYPSYQRMTVEDVLDLKAYMDTLPAVAEPSPGHDLPLPLRVRRGIGLWKRLYMDYRPFQPGEGADEQLKRGAYLVTGPGHCGACHTPRNMLGGPEPERAYSGGPAPEGDGTIPNITPHEDGIGDWSVGDIKTALRTGLLPDFESFGGDMVAVQENMAELTEADREAIAVYLKALPPRPSWWKK